jgi:hypothetical protein
MTSIRSRSVLLASAAVLTAALAVSSCAGVKRAVGADKVTPDEFRVVTKAPLVVPPEYNLRPPQPGEPRPEDLVPSDAAANVAYGGYGGSTASDAEQMLVGKIATGASDPTIRVQIEAENGVVQKRRGFANRVLFWREGDVVDEADPTQLAAEDEIARRAELGAAATGGEPVRIGGRGKLPGL